MYPGTRTPPVALTIAGSDSGGGAGIQADLKAFAANGAYGTSAITAVTAQNTKGVLAIDLMSPLSLYAQIDAVTSDFFIRGSKTGMLGSIELLEIVADFARRGTLPKLIVDPVMIATSGDILSPQSIVSGYREFLLPYAYVVTPNIPEAELLSEIEITNQSEMVRAAQLIHRFGPKYVYIKGGHLEGDESIDIFFDGQNVSNLRTNRIATPNTHGTGCTFSAALAAQIACGQPIDQAIRNAKIYTTKAIMGGSSWALGSGAGPLDHFLWSHPDQF
ncbi:bifunctional hydroxymethylpyrimidine kinase/phosphomethylpyrimidine kinase [Acidithrix sp. C25]|uniref:bifunctional hydroxymethylpyrimidine kinase/phosphomethylpyrimidine kinase n=1 Tax=Acidithrix sp. C25 TaxID=1671482 RepID=UPI00191B9D47|nr:bifunctional hydroxymethylpyrimidine kinase/phosphomethylpyrimidine kinase [Acidithrix sp. C25]CAG4924114.1 unnamed protein product [Acidithrix sp. C25]